MITMVAMEGRAVCPAAPFQHCQSCLNPFSDGLAKQHPVLAKPTLILSCYGRFKRFQFGITARAKVDVAWHIQPPSFPLMMLAQ
jgi:hypothetical protein